MNKSIFILLLLVVSLLAACAQKAEEPAVPEAAIYFQEGEVFFAQGLYKEAIDSWQKVRDSYYSPELNILAELKIAEALFLDEEYLEAAVAYEAFLQSHPDHARVADVLYQLGLSYSYQILNYDQDQSATRSALKTFATLKERFPHDPRREEVQVYMDNCLNQLAASDLDVGKFYLKREVYSASINRFEGVLKRYPNFYGRDEAFYLLGKAYLKSGNQEKAEMAFNTLFEDFSGSEFVPEAREFIEDNL